MLEQKLWERIATGVFGCVKIRIGQRAGELACIKYGDGMGWEFLFPLLGSGEKRTCPFFWDGSVSCDRLLFIVWN
jgi:hypothetical protein